MIAVCETPVVLPIATGGNFARARGFAVPLDGVGLKTPGIVRCDQPLAMDLTARRCRKVDSAPRAIVGEVLAKLLPIFN